MSLTTKITSGFGAVSTAIRAIRTLITGSPTGNLTGLSTTVKTSVVAAINEVDSETTALSSSLSTTNTNIGALASLATTDKTSIVNATNEVRGNALQLATTSLPGRMSAADFTKLSKLPTTTAPRMVASGSLVGAVNVDVTGLLTGVDDNVTEVYVVLKGVSSTTATRNAYLYVSTDNGVTFFTTLGNYLSATATSDRMCSIALATAATAYDITFFINDVRQILGNATASAQRTAPTANAQSRFAAPYFAFIANALPINALRINHNGTGNFDAGTYQVWVQ